MDCALSDSAPLAISATEVLECIVRGGLAAPNDVISRFFASLISGLPHTCRSGNKSHSESPSDCISQSSLVDCALRTRH